jgi:hypothetical protein
VTGSVVVSWCVRSRLSISLTLSCSCLAACPSKPSTSQVEVSPPAGTTGATQPARVDEPVEPPAAVPEPDETDEDELEQAEVDLHEVPFDADLDADGQPEAISWTCSEASVELRVGRAKYRAKLGFADLIGCMVAVVDLDPDVDGSQLWLHADEHDEVGPNRNFLLRHAGGKLEEIWVEDLELEIYVDGSWRTEDSECVESERLYRTTTTLWRWRAARVVEDAEVSTTPMSADETCDVAEP